MMAERKHTARRPRRAAREHTALLLSAGAPHSPLMAGFLCATYDEGKAFKIIHTSGAGVLIGLLYVAPKDKNPDQALRDIVELAVADPIYQLFPINYKVFFKPGPFTQPIRLLAQAFKLAGPLLRPIPDPGTDLEQKYNELVDLLRRIPTPVTGPRRLYNDLVDFWAAVLTPTTLNYWSKGLCEPLPFLEEMVDFKKLYEFDGHFYLNAFNVTDGKMEVFSNQEKPGITPAHVRAAFAHPFIYRPVHIDGKVYFEGADREPICFRHLLDMRQHIKTVVLLDILGGVEPDSPSEPRKGLEPALLREPRNLREAFAMSILMPVIGLAKQEVKYFKEVLNKENGKDIFDFVPVDFNIPEELWPHITDWSYSNLKAMWDIGYKTGLKFCQDHGGLLSERY